MAHLPGPARFGLDGLGLAVGGEVLEGAYSGMNVTWTLPVGPLRCLPMITSATRSPSSDCRPYRSGR